ncbi:DUF6153 family protein [Dactylosporangium sp. NPDC051485]|uniref:DUF6153 family protein n=1 Tax=Dactylosporangium sp. NPDC051485 TaxID=3154846 RepID=UPI00341C97D9
MAQVGNGTVGRAARLVLLLATLLGLAAMHTLGHAGPHMIGDHRHAPAAEHSTVMPIAAVIGAVTGCDGDDCGRLLATAGHERGGMGDWAVCLAILVAFAIVVLAAMLFTRRRASLTTARGRRARCAAPRAPPPRLVGLTLATVSVLRT